MNRRVAFRVLSFFESAGFADELDKPLGLFQNTNMFLKDLDDQPTQKMKTHKNLYQKLCSLENLELAHEKARKRKTKTKSVIKFEKNLEKELTKLREELFNKIYKPKPLRKFTIRDPKTRVIHAAAYRDRVVHHAVINIIGPIFEATFICDSYASRLEKGTHNAVQRFDKFKRKVSRNGKLVKRFWGGGRSRNPVEGYVLKTDIKHYFDTVNHDTLINIINRKIKDEKLIWLIREILNGYECQVKGRGMPLGNYTSQFFANIYLNKLDYFVKHHLKAKYYIRYVDDLIILHKRKKILEYYQNRIDRYLECLHISLHPDKTKILPLRNGISFLGYRVFYHHKLLRKRNMRCFRKKLDKKLLSFENGDISKGDFLESLQGWFGYAKWANTYMFRKELLDKIEQIDSVITKKLRQQKGLKSS